MIDVYVYKLGRHYTGFRTKGHANYAKVGEDIVCAGVSALTITLENSLQMLCGVPIHKEQREDEEFPRFQFPYANEKIDLLMDSYIIGIDGLAEQYPNHVRLHLE